MEQKLSKCGLPICPEVCECCENGEHAMHVVTEMANLVVTVESRVRKSDGREIKSYKIEGGCECDCDSKIYPNLWISDLFLDIAYLLKDKK